MTLTDVIKVIITIDNQCGQLKYSALMGSYFGWRLEHLLPRHKSTGMTDSDTGLGLGLGMGLRMGMV